MIKRSNRPKVIANNCKMAKTRWNDEVDPLKLSSLREITRAFGFSIAMGDMLLLNGAWYVTHAGLLGLAKRRCCAGIDVEAVSEFCDLTSSRWSFKATVYKSKKGRGFAGHGDASPSNVSSLVRGAEMRVAETRAVNRALRKAYGIGLCSVEELGWTPRPPDGDQPNPIPAKSNGNGYHGGGQPRLRDQLCLLIRHYNLDPSLVKAYAAHFCGTETIKDASRDLVESFVSHLAASAKEDLDGLICKLNSYARPVEAKP